MKQESQASGENAANSEQSSTPARRRLLKALAGAGGAFAAAQSLPEKWTRPVVDAVLLPAHAQATGLGPWSGTGEALREIPPVFGPGPARGVGGRLLDAVIPPAHAGVVPTDLGIATLGIYVCIATVNGTTVNFKMWNCCGGPLEANCHFAGNSIDCNVGAYTVKATLAGNTWTGTVTGPIPICLETQADPEPASPFNPQRKLLAEQRSTSLPEKILDAVVPAAHAQLLDFGWTFSAPPGTCSPTLQCDSVS